MPFRENMLIQHEMLPPTVNIVTYVNRTNHLRHMKSHEGKSLRKRHLNLTHQIWTSQQRHSATLSHQGGDTRIQQTYLKISRPQGNLLSSWWLWELGNEGFQNWWWPRIMMIHWVIITLWLILHDLGWSFWTLFFGSQVIRFSNPQIISRHLNWAIDL